MRSSTSVLLALALLLAPACGRQEPTARHLVLVTIDTLRADRLGSHGRIEAIERLDSGLLVQADDCAVWERVD